MNRNRRTGNGPVAATGLTCLPRARRSEGIPTQERSPPPRTRFSSDDGRGTRGWDETDTSESAVATALGSPVHPARRDLAAGPAGAGVPSTRGRVDSHWGLGQKPIHRGALVAALGAVEHRPAPFSRFPPFPSSLWDVSYRDYNGRNGRLSAGKCQENPPDSRRAGEA